MRGLTTPPSPPQLGAYLRLAGVFLSRPLSLPLPRLFYVVFPALNQVPAALLIFFFPPPSAPPVRILIATLHSPACVKRSLTLFRPFRQATRFRHTPFLHRLFPLSPRGVLCMACHPCLVSGGPFYVALRSPSSVPFLFPCLFAFRGARCMAMLCFPPTILRAARGNPGSGAFLFFAPYAACFAADFL